MYEKRLARCKRLHRGTHRRQRINIYKVINMWRFTPQKAPAPEYKDLPVAHTINGYFSQVSLLVCLINPRSLSC